MIDFTLSEQQTAVRNAARSFASGSLSTAWATYSQHAEQYRRFQAIQPIYREAVKAGLVKAQVPRSMGGAGGSLVDAAIVTEELYAVETSVPLTVLATGLGLLPLILGGSEEQREEFLKPFIDGEGEPLASLVHSEPDGTANWLEKGGKGLQTTAQKVGEDWVISGDKMWATNCAGWDFKGATLQSVVCRQAPQASNSTSDDPKDSIIILLVTPQDMARNDPGAFTLIKHVEKAGHSAVSGPHVRYTNLRVPAKNLVAGADKGAAIIEQCFDATAGLVGALSTGLMRATFSAALDFTKRDSRGGSVPILARQSTADLMMDIKMRTEASRYLTWKACHCLENGPGEYQDRRELALEAKIYCSDNAVKCVVDAMKAVGMSSYAKDQPFTDLMNDALCLPIFDGGNIGIRRRQLEKLFLAEDYKPWAAVYGRE
ncbi:MAG: hypothetical protein M1830_002313 [Pleopsidium flavum]|nr:MAG: hypothetical protein M1830_002313 [Pleopsidium flavum]